MKTRKNHLRKRKQKQTAGIRSNLSNDEKQNVRAIVLYEQMNPNRNKTMKGNSMTIQQRIQSLLQKQTPLTDSIVVWRGQWNQTIIPAAWFSSSFYDKIARSYGGRNLFKIHLQPGVRCLDMYDFYRRHGIENPYMEQNAMKHLMKNEPITFYDDYGTFGEVLVSSGGSFWQDSEKTKAGFRYIGKISQVEPGTWKNSEEDFMDMYETYYFP